MLVILEAALGGGSSKVCVLGSLCGDWECTFSFNNASLAGLDFGVGRGGPETLSVDIVNCRMRVLVYVDQCPGMSALPKDLLVSLHDVVCVLVVVANKVKLD